MEPTGEEHLFSLLMKNLPSKVHCSHNKAGARSKPSIPTHIALKSYEFIEYNSKERVTIVVFDKDLHKGVVAKEYFPDIPTFYEWLIEKLDLQPTYVCETNKGYQFGFVIKGFLTVQHTHAIHNKTPQKYLQDIKSRYIDFLELDKIASSRSHATFRNPIKHRYLSFPQKIYNLNDLNQPVIGIKLKDYLSISPDKSHKTLNGTDKIMSERNCTIFKLCCKKFAYSKPTKSKIFGYAQTLNINKCYEPLPNCEIKSITNSIYKRCQDSSLKSGSRKAQVNREKLVKSRKKLIIKYVLKCKKENRKLIKVHLAKHLSISVTALTKTYGGFLKVKYKI